MHAKPALLLLFLWLPISGCTVRIPVSEAIAVPIADNESTVLDQQHPHTTAGKWWQVRATLSRDVVRKIVRWELYTHLRVEDCRSGKLVAIASSVGIEGTDGDFKKSRRQLDLDEQQPSFVIAEPMLVPTSKTFQPLCARLEGGSYTLQTISSSPVAIRFTHNST